MKATILAVALAGSLMVGGPAPADDLLQKKIEVIRAICMKESQLAEMIMRNRQGGLPMRLSLEAHESVKEKDPALYELARYMTMEAYEEERWPDGESQLRVVTEFGNKHLLRCLNALEEELRTLEEEP